MIVGYRKFLYGFKVNENIAGAKKILKDTYIFNKAASQVSGLKVDKTGMVLLSDGDPIKSTQVPEEVKAKIKAKIREIKLTPEEIQLVDKNPKLKEIRDIISGKDGYAQLFMYLYIKELTPIEELKRIFSGLVEYNDLLARLRRPINNYIDPNIENNTEQLVDDIEELARWRKLKKFVNEFTKVLKDSYKETPKVFKDKLVDIAAAFDELGKDESTGKIDAEKQRVTQKRFFDKIGRYQSIRDLITSAEEFLKSEANADSSKFYASIEKVNQKYGTYGANLLYDEGGLLIVEVKSFQACKDLYSNTSWCIASYQSHWDSYVGGDAKYTRQYCVTNFNLPPSDNKSIIGITIGPNKKVEACHLKNDSNASSSFMDIFATFEKALGLKKGFIWEGMDPMTKEDQERKRRRIEANKNITKLGLTLDQVKKFIIDDGADPNYQQGKALENAVTEADPNSDKYKEAVEKIKFLLDYGASPNLKSEGDAIVNKVKTFEVLKLLISKQAALTKIAFKTLANDYEAVKFCLENGLDPDFENNMPMRLAIKEGRLDIIKLLEANGVSEENKRCNITKHAAEHMFFEVLDYFIQKGGNYVKELDQVMHWVAHSVRRTREEKIKILEVLQKYIDDGIGEFNKGDSYIIGRDKNRKKVDIDYILKHYKSLKDFYISKIDEKK